MAINEYDELLQGKPAATTNEYDSTVQSVNDSDQLSVRGAMRAAGRTTPDRAAQVIKLSERTKVPPEIVERNFDTLSKKYDLNDNEYESLVKENPRLTGWLSDPVNASVAADDVPVLQRIENTLTSFGGGWSRAATQARLADLLYHEVEQGDLQPQDAAERDALKKRMQALSGDPAGVPEYIAGVTGYSARQMLSSSEATLTGVGAGGIAGAVAGSVLPGVGTVAGGSAGMIAGGVTASANYSYRLETAFAFDELRSLKDLNGNPLDPKLTRTAAKAVGAINSIIESGSSVMLASLVPGVKNVIGSAIGKDAAKQAMLREVKNALANPTRRQMMMGALGKMAAAASVEGLEEFMQSLVGSGAREVTQGASGQNFSPDSAVDDIDQAAREAMDAAVGTFFTFAPVGGASFYVDARKAAKAKQQAQFFEALGQGVSESKTFQRLPEKMQDFIERATADGPIETVHVPVEQWVTYWQSKGLDPAAVAEEVLGETTMYESAITTGVDLAIPMSRYATKIAPTEHNGFFSQEIRLAPDEMNAREAAEFETRIAEEQKALEDQQTRADVEAGVATLDQSATAVREDVIGQLLGSGYDRATAETYASTHEAMFRAIGERSGISPFEAYQRYGLKIGRPMPDILKKRVNADDLDAILDRLRSGSIPSEGAIYGKSLVELLREKGGVIDEGGELAARDADKGLKPFQKRLANPQGMSLDTAREMAAQMGYIGQDSTVAEFLDLIDQDVRGTPVYAEGVQKPEQAAIANAAQQLDGYLRDLGLDLNAMTNDQVRAAIQANSNVRIDESTELSQRQGQETLPEKIEVDGVERHTRNNLGQQIAATKEAVEAFWRWFGDSKVVDADGRPLVVYHGTSEQFSEFERMGGKVSTVFGVEDVDRNGFFFTASREMAVEFGENIVDAYLSIKNPIDLTNGFLDGDLKALADAGISESFMTSKYPRYMWEIFDGSDGAALESAIKSVGMDGAIIVEEGAKNIGLENVYVAFDSTQIKSATGNRGTFDPLTGNILHQSDVERDLIITHNVTAGNILHANRLGGIPVPSLAITRAGESMTNFGEITLIGSREMADPRGYAGTKVFGADIYSPRYPNVEYKFKDAKLKLLGNELKDGLKATSSVIDVDNLQRRGIDELQNNAAVMWEFLRTRGITPAAVTKEGLSAEREKILRDAGLGEYFPDRSNQYDIIHSLARNEEFQKKAGVVFRKDVLDSFIAIGDKNPEDSTERLIKDYTPQSMAAEIAREVQSIRDRSKPDNTASKYKMREQIDAGLLAEFDAFVSDLFESLDAEERIFRGFTNSGNRSYQPHTLENVVKILKKELRGGESKTNIYGMGQLRSKFAPQFKSVAQIKAASGRLISDAEFEEIKKEVEGEFFALVEAVKPAYQSSINEFGFTDIVMAVIEETPSKGLDRAAKDMGFDPEMIHDETREQLREFITRLRNMPTEYFEAKILREVDLSEFAGAVVPEGVDPRVEEILRSRGVAIIHYAKGPNGNDVANRQAAVKSFAADLGDKVLFQPAYHGSPHTFDKFSLDAIGTGEGAQAYGWGLYFAENPGIADGYRRALSKTIVKWDGKKVGTIDWNKTSERSKVARKMGFTDKQEIDTVETLLRSYFYHSGNVARVEKDISEYSDYFRPRYEAMWPKIKDRLSADSKGLLYQVDIDDRAVENMLDWDKTLEEQSDNVKAALADSDYKLSISVAESERIADERIDADAADWADETGGDPVEFSNNADRDKYIFDVVREFGGVDSTITGRDLYKMIVKDEGGGRDLFESNAEYQKAASEYLNRLGIKGIKYLDASSRRDGDGTRNLVVFDDSIVTITHKDGKPLTAKERKEFLQSDDKAGNRGRIRWSPDRKFSIDMLDGADLSTFVHESGHFWLEVLGDVVDDLSRRDPAGLSQQQIRMVDDYQKLLDWFGVKDRQSIGVDQHEQFARGIEAYFMEGNAPSSELRSVFARVRAWMMSIYRSLKQLNVNLTPEVREVFDRMFATDQQIEQAEAESKVEGMFLTAADAGMNEREFNAYRSKIEAASRVAKETLGAKIMRTLNRERLAWWKAERATVRDEVAAEVNAMPEQIALSVLTKGVMPDGSEIPDGVAAFKLARKEIDSIYGEGAWRTLPRGSTALDGLPLAAAASVLGYESGDALIRAVRAARPAKALIEAETDARMRERHGDPLVDGNVADLARAAVHNEERSAVIEAELKALNKLRAASSIAVQQARKTGKAEQRQGVAMLRSPATIPPLATISRIARGMIAQMRARDIRPGQYLAAARKASQAATVAAGEQDFNRAIANKQRELLNVELYRAATKAREEVEAIADYMQGFGKAAKRSRIAKAGQDYLDQIDGFLDRYEFARVPLSSLDRRDALATWIAAKERAGEPVSLPPGVENETRTNYKNMTVDELRGVHDSVKHIEHLAKLKNKLLTAKSQKELQIAIDEIVASINDNAKSVRGRRLETRLPSDEAMRLVESGLAMHRKLSSMIREMDGVKDGGVMWEYIIRPINESADNEAVMNRDATERFKALFDAYKGTDQSALYAISRIDEIDNSLSKMGRIAVALNWGNADNRQKIMDGYGWNEQQIAAILNGLDQRDWDFVQGVWDFIDTYWPAIESKEKRVNGIAPEKVEAMPVMTSFGEYRGGYYPLKYDDRQSAQAHGDRVKEMAEQMMKGAYTRATTRRGHTQARVEGVKRPIRLDFGVMFEHVAQVIHDVTHHEMLIDVNRLLGSKEVSGKIIEVYGDVTYKQMQAAITDIAAGNIPAIGAFEKSINWVRTGMTISAMGWNIMTSLLQPFGISQSMVRVGPKWVGKGLARWFSDATHLENTAAWIMEKSPLMRSRIDTQLREINEIRQEVGLNTGKFSGWIDEAMRTVTLDKVSKQAVVDSYFWLIYKGQQIADIPTWIGAYEKARAESNDEARSVALADQAVIDSQGGGQMKDLAGIQRGGPLLKVWTSFYSYFNVTYNLSVESVKRTNFRSPGQIGRLAVDFLLLYTLPATMAALMRAALKGDDGGDEGLLAMLIRENLSYLTGIMVGLREIGSVIQGYQGYNGPAGTRFFSSLSKMIKQVEQGEADAAFWRSLNETAGIVLHYPAGQVRRTVEGFAALQEGRTKNPMALLVGPPKE